MLSSVLCLLLLIANVADDVAASRHVETAKELVKQLASRDFDGAVVKFDATMKSVLPASKLSEAWDQGVVGIYGPLKSATETRTQKLDQYDVVFVAARLERGTVDVKIVLSEDGLVAGLFFLPTAKYQAPSYALADSFEELEVTVGKGFWTLPGTISLPKGDGPFPAVVLVHGSGPQDRDSSIGPNKPLRDIAHGLASKGIAVLRYEKRTKHHQLKMALFSSTITAKEEVIDDAVAAVDLLAAHAKIDSHKIFVLGHSFGGSMLPRIAQASDKIAGLISMAGSTRHLEDSILAQTQYLVGLDGQTTAEEAQAMETIAKQVAAVKSLAPGVDTSKLELPLGVPAKYWLDLQSYDAAEAAKDVSKPMLFLQGGRDYQVPEADAAKWKAALGTRGDVKFIDYPTLNHLFIEGAGVISPQEYLLPGNVAARVIDDLAAWIKAVR